MMERLGKGTQRRQKRAKEHHLNPRTRKIKEEGQSIRTSLDFGCHEQESSMSMHESSRKTEGTRRCLRLAGKIERN